MHVAWLYENEVGHRSTVVQDCVKKCPQSAYFVIILMANISIVLTVI